MSQSTFVIMAFVATGFAMAWLVVSSYAGMRKSEALSDDLRSPK